MQKNEVNINEIVKKEYNSKFLQEGISATKTSYFVLPMIDTTIAKLGKYFKNAFIKDIDYDTIVDRPLFLLFDYDYKTKDEQIFCKNLHDYLIAKKEFVTYYYAGNIDNTKSIIYLFSINKEFEHDYNMFLNGSYSKFRNEFKSVFPRDYKNSEGIRQHTIAYQVLNKSPKLKLFWEETIGVKFNETMELWSKISESEESI